MTETEFQIIRSIGFVSALTLAIPVQRWRPHTALAGSWRTNAGLWAINALLLGLICAGCACTVSRWADLSGLGLFNWGAVSAWITIPVSVIALDLVSYFWHRANHVFPFLWRFHRAHHSDLDYTVTTALRFHPGELLLALPIRLIAVVALGVPIIGLIAFEVIFAFANFWEHGNIDLPHDVERALGTALITPAVHRRHHSKERRHRDTNYGTIFSIWDRTFGSYVDSRPGVAVDTGLPEIAAPLGLFGILSIPLRPISTLD